MKKLFVMTMLVLFTSYGMAQVVASKNTHSIENTLQKLEVNCNIGKAYNLAYRTAAEYNWIIKSSDSKMYAFSAETPKTMKRWDDNVNVYIDMVNDTLCIINVKSTLGHKPNKEFITQYLDSIEEKLK